MSSCKSILVVDDDADIRRNVVEALELEDYHVLTAENGLEALKLLRALPKDDHPGCIILDLMMPEMNGMTFIEELNREHPNDLAKIKIIIATAKGSPVTPEQVPVNIERIQKPFELEQLYKVVSEHCGESLKRR